MLPAESHWFFIVGCQRSGTTLLRLILECHSQVFCLDEAQSYRVLSERKSEHTPRGTHIGFKIPRFTEQLDADAPYDYGLAERPAAFYRGQKVLFMVRDVRDAVASMRKLRGERSWLEDWAVPIVEDKAQREPEFARRYQAELARCRGSASPTTYGALYWRYKNEALLRYLAQGYPVLPVRYEALVAEPARELSRIAGWLGLALEPSMLSHPGHEHGELDERGLAIGNTNPKRTIDADSVGQWQEWLTRDEEAEMLALTTDVRTQVERALTGSQLVATPATESSAPVRSAAPERVPSLSSTPRGSPAPWLWLLSGCAVMLLAAARIASRPIWSFGLPDFVFWSAALLTALVVWTQHLPLPRARSETLPQLRRGLAPFAVASTGLWLMVQSIEL